MSIREARLIALHAQGLLGPRLPGGVTALLRRVRAVQLDTISVLARSHELVVYARQGPTSRTTVDRAYWGTGSRTFEYWSHAACILPLEEWPAYGAQRRARLRRGRRWHRLPDAAGACAAVTRRLRDDGPLTARQLGGAKRGGPWWDWSETKIAAEWLLDIGELVCRERRGFQRVYDLAERAIPEELRDAELDDEACAVRLVRSAAGALGVASVADLAPYHGLTGRAVRQVVDMAGLQAVHVEGWDRPGYCLPGVLDSLPSRLRRHTVLLSPFDSLIWDRGRTERLFGFHHRLEAYVPRDKRVHGYFAMPVLAGDRFVGLVDPARQGRTLVARHVSLDTAGAAPAVARALREAARWVNCDDIALERVTPTERAAELRALTAAGE